MDRCLYCGHGIPLLTRLGGEHHYCSKEHKKAFQVEYEKRAVQALSRPAPPPDPADAGWVPEMAVAHNPGIVPRVGDLSAFNLIGEAWVPSEIGGDGPAALSVASETLAMDAGVSEMALTIHQWDSTTAVAFPTEAGLPVPRWRAEIGENGQALSAASDMLAIDAGVSEMASAIHQWDSATTVAFPAEAGLPVPCWRAKIGEDGPALSAASDTLALDAGVSAMAFAIHQWDNATPAAFPSEAKLPVPRWCAEMAQLSMDDCFASTAASEALLAGALCILSPTTVVVALMAPPPALPWAMTGLTSGPWSTASLLPVDPPPPTPVRLRWNDEILPAVPFVIATCKSVHLTPAGARRPAYAPLQPLDCSAMNHHSIAGIATALPVEFTILPPSLSSAETCVLALAGHEPMDWPLTASENGGDAKLTPQAEAGMAFVPQPLLPRCASQIPSPWIAITQAFPCPQNKNCETPAALLHRALVPPPFRGPIEWKQFLATDMALGGDSVTAWLGAPDWPRARIPEKPSALPGVYDCGQADWMPPGKAAPQQRGIYVPIAQGYPLRPRISCSATPV